MKRITLLIVFLLAFAADSYAQFPQGFENAGFPPTGWATFVGTNGLGTGENWHRVTDDATTGTASAFVSYDNSSAGSIKEDWLVTPQFTVSASAPLLSYFQRQDYTAEYNSVYTVRVSTTSQTDIASFTTVSTETESDFGISFTPKQIDMAAYVGQQVYVAFVMANDDGDNWYLDDINMTAAIAAPDCATNPAPANGVVNVPVGENEFSWTAPAGEVTGYDLYAGDTEDNLGFVGSFQTASAALNISGYDATIYWQIIPKNAGGLAIGCTVWSFTTEPLPAVPANDACANATAITSFPYSDSQNAAGATNNAGFIVACDADVSAMNDGVWYTVGGNGFDLTVNIQNVEGWDPQVDVYSGTCGALTCVGGADDFGASGSESVVILASAIGTTYYINVGHYSGTADELEGPYTINVITATNETPDYASLWSPINATITQGQSVDVYGQIYQGGLTDVEPGLSGQAAGIEAWVGVSATDTNPNTWAEEDWVEAEFNAAQVSNNDEYEAAIGGALNPGTYYYATRFRLNNGLYVYGGINAAGDGNFWNGTGFNSGVLTVSPADVPINDECATPIQLTTGGIFTDNDIVGNSAGGSNNAADDAPTCGDFNFETDGKDVWFSITVPASGSVTVETSDNNSLEDSVMELYSGTCGALLSIDCNDDIDGADNRFSSISVADRTPGEILIARVWGYDGSAGSFSISAFDASLGTPVFNAGQISYYPNPVKDVLNLSFGRTVSGVSVYNLLGQEVLSKTLDSNEAQVDLSALPSGTYVVKANAEGEIMTIKVIKQ
jgi:hypothetical protein